MQLFVQDAWTLFLSLWYWVPVGVLLGEVVQAKIPMRRVERALGTGHTGSLAAASAAGAALPLCACGVIPFLVTFLSLGIPLAPILAFTAASPIMDPADLVLTLEVLGWRFALVTLAAALALGLGTGGAYLFLRRRGWVEATPRVRAVPAQEATTGTPDPAALVRRLGAQLWFVGKYLLLAIVLGALLQTLVPTSVIRGLLGTHTWYALPVGVLLGLGTYGISSVPFAKVLLGLGAAPGAVMAFFLAGHATSVGLLTAMATLVRWRTFALYVVMTVALSLLFGVLYQVLV